MNNGPKLSIQVIVYDMAEQAMNTLYSLSTHYQKNIAIDDYEVIVVENRSDNCLNETAIKEVLPNSRYFLREEESQTPVHAINFGFEHKNHLFKALFLKLHLKSGPNGAKYLIQG